MQHTRTAFDALSTRHKAFVAAYLAGADRFNAAKSYINAGYRSRHPKTCAHALLQREDIQAAIAEQMTEGGLTPAWIRQRIAEMSRGVDIADLEPYLLGHKTLQQLRDEGVDTSQVKYVNRTETRDGRSGYVIQTIDPSRALAAAIRVLGMALARRELVLSESFDLSRLGADELRRLKHALHAE